MQGLKRLRVIQELSQKKPNWEHTDLFRILRKEDLWIAAFENIKGNKEALTPGKTSKTLDGTSLEKLRKLQTSILNESYQFTPVKQILIPKPNGKSRPLGLPTPNDKIVQEVLRMILEAIYEPIFDYRSFGFRRGIGVHDALQHVDKEFRWVDWVIKGDIKNAYPTIDHKRLCEIMEKRISDTRFMNLIRKSLKCGTYVDPNTLYSKLGVPQGSIVAPILANIYFNELDQWVTRKGTEIYTEASTQRNSEYRSFEYKIKKVSDQLNQTELNPMQRKSIVREVKQLIQERNQIPRVLNSGTQIRYVRYADDWMIGVKGPKSLASQLKEEVKEFLQLHLKQELDIDKTQIIQLQAGKATFLGYDLFLPRNMKRSIVKQGTKLTSRLSTNKLRFQVPVKTLIKRLKERGYVAYEGNRVRPISKRSYSTLEDKVIVHHFRSVWLGISNFYSGVTNLSHLQYIHYLLHMSCAMTLAHHHRTTSSKIFKKHGKQLQIWDKVANPPRVMADFPYRTKWKLSDREWKTRRIFRDPFTIYANRVSKSRLDKPCRICASANNIEMHHVKHVRKKGYRYSGFTAEMALWNRKQIPLCKECHKAVHRGEYDGIKLSKLD